MTSTSNIPLQTFPNCEDSVARSFATFDYRFTEETLVSLSLFLARFPNIFDDFDEDYFYEKLHALFKQNYDWWMHVRRKYGYILRFYIKIVNSIELQAEKNKKLNSYLLLH